MNQKVLNRKIKIKTIVNDIKVKSVKLDNSVKMQRNTFVAYSTTYLCSNHCSFVILL